MSTVKELQRELEKLKSIERLKQAELDRYKEQNEKQRKKLKEMEDQYEQMVEKTHTLKKEKGNLESQMLFEGGRGNG